jgi:hypothetical protein
MTKKNEGSGLNLKMIGIGAVVILAIVGVFLITRPNTSLGSQNTPYNSSFGYQGQGYYAYKGGVFYSTSQSQFASSMASVTNNSQKVGSTALNSSKSTQQTSAPTTTQQPTTTIQPCTTPSVPLSAGHSINCGSFKVVLTSVNSQSVTVNVYYNNATTNSSTIYSGSSQKFSFSGNPLYIAVGSISGSTAYVQLSSSPITLATSTTTIPQTQQQAHGTIQNGQLSFSFYLLNGSIDTWSFPLTTYNYYVSQPRIDPILVLNNSITGKTLYTWDYRSTVTPSFFANVTPTLTTGKTAAQFVAQVQSINSQLVNYSLVFANTSIYPAQLIAQGQGDCKDKGVMMASILEAGNIKANYGMKIQFVYVDAYNLSTPRTIDHLMLSVTYANGTREILDTTHVLATSPYYNGTINGWYFNLTCTMSGCQEPSTCSGAYCDEVGYSSGGSTGFASCSSSNYLVGSDGLCHAECGRPYTNTYCNSGYSCNSQNYCAS